MVKIHPKMCPLCNEEFETDELLKKHLRICIFCIDQKEITEYFDKLFKDPEFERMITKAMNEAPDEYGA